MEKLPSKILNEICANECGMNPASYLYSVPTYWRIDTFWRLIWTTMQRAVRMKHANEGHIVGEKGQKLAENVLRRLIDAVADGTMLKDGFTKFSI